MIAVPFGIGTVNRSIGSFAFQYRHFQSTTEHRDGRVAALLAMTEAGGMAVFFFQANKKPSRMAGFSAV